jgi:hypothetical protein
MPDRNPLMSSLRQDARKLGLSGRLAITVLVVLLVLALFGVVFEAPDSGTRLSDAGTIIAIVGGVAMVLVGMGLMALIFYSSRHGYDESAERQKDQSDRKD